MILLRFLLGYSRGTLAWTTLTAVMSGACNAGLIALVNAVLNAGGTPSLLLIWSFVALGLGRLLSTFLAQVALARFTQQSTASLRQDLVRKILAEPLRQLEEIGAPRLMVALTEDVMNITQALLSVPAFAVNLAILGGGAVYLGWLSPVVLLAMMGFILLGAIVYRLFIQQGFSWLESAREEEDRLFRHFRSLTEGIKELKLHRERRGAFLSESIQTATAAYARHNLAAEMRFIIAHNWSHLLFFTLIGLILFLLPRVDRVDARALTGYVVTILYLMGPLSGVLGSLSVFGRANVALRKIEQLGLALTSGSRDDCPIGREVAQRSFRRLELLEATHSYHREKEDDHFMLGPITLTFHPGEVVFLVGGNGSGKSTLAKVVTGLYPPASGHIRLDGEIIGAHNRDDYRQHFSAVFADYHLFDNFPGLRDPGMNGRGHEYLAQLHLDHKVKIRNGALSTLDLSQGQRKRLALLTAYLEDRPFYVFDEWASDQDPLFKEVFYAQLVPELKSRNKAVLVITHDDAYFPLADRLIKLDYGQIVSAVSDALVATARE